MSLGLRVKSGLCHCIALVEATIFWFVEVVETVAVAVAVSYSGVYYVVGDQSATATSGRKQPKASSDHLIKGLDIILKPAPGIPFP